MTWRAGLVIRLASRAGLWVVRWWLAATIVARVGWVVGGGWLGSWLPSAVLASASTGPSLFGGRGATVTVSGLLVTIPVVGGVLQRLWRALSSVLSCCGPVPLAMRSFSAGMQNYIDMPAGLALVDQCKLICWVNPVQRMEPDSSRAKWGRVI